MAPFPDDEPPESGNTPGPASAEYAILKQRVDLDISFSTRTLRGSTEITLQPLVKNLKEIALHCRQCRPTTVQIGGINATWTHRDPYRRAHMPELSTVHQHHMLREKVEKSLRPSPQPELMIAVPGRVKIQELRVDAVAPVVNGAGGLKRAESDLGTLVESAHAHQQGPQFAPIQMVVEFEILEFRDGLHWIGIEHGDKRYPCVYTKASTFPGTTSSIFPCLDDATSRCSWEFAIRCPRTLGDAFRIPDLPVNVNGISDHDVKMDMGDGIVTKTNVAARPKAERYSIDLSDEEAALDLAVVCVGDQTEDIADPEDPARHTLVYSLSQPVAARHVGFAVGPFEHVSLSSLRNADEEERLGHSAVKIHGYCMPGRRGELSNTCMPISWAVDSLGVKYGSFPFSSYQIVFVDDFVYDTIACAGLSFCTSSLLFPQSIIEPMDRHTRTLIRTLAEQWSGVNLIPSTPGDEWAVAGIAGFITDMYMKELAGNNEFRWQQKLAAEKVYEMDVDRPSVRDLGYCLHLDHSIRDFINLKSALVLFILDRRLMKTTGSTGVTRIISKIFLNVKTGALNNGEISTTDFQRTCERLGHNKLDPFFRQWVLRSGCPIFYVTQKFNKKKLVVEMTIAQRQLERTTKPQFEPNNFMREIKEHVQEVWAPETNPVFTGPMTIRIHEADGTPYEHIVEIKEATTRLEIPYNTKYKRLKRSRRQKERHITEGANGEGGEDALLYCLGDILDTEEEKRVWDLTEWTEEDEEKMGQESYEWIRMDADFEWIGKIHLVMPLYMYISQLQQDRDIVAQYESMRYLLGSNPHHVNLTICLRTLMDSRYFWGIREMAAEGLAISAKDKWRELGQFHLIKAFRQLFCIGNTNMPKANDFSDRRHFIIQSAIPKAMAKLRDQDGKVPLPIRQFFVDVLKFNDNSNNRWHHGDPEGPLISDNHYIATLMDCLADSLIASHREPQPTYTFSFGDEEPMETDNDNADAEFEKTAVAQIERHRRIDEWEPSYQNIYSITALGCLQRLTKAGIVKDKTQEVMKYVRAGNAENVRLAAYRCLTEIGVFKKVVPMRFLLQQLAIDPSPRFRDRLLRILGEALGHIALGDPEPSEAPAAPPSDAGLIVEQVASNEARRLAATRKTSPEGALAALKASFANETSFAEALWSTATARELTLDELTALCDIAALVYEASDALTVSIELPRMWRCKRDGPARLRFTPAGAIRTTPKTPLSFVDWKRLQDLSLRYTGQLSADIAKHQQQMNLKLKAEQEDQEAAIRRQLAEVQQQLQQAQGIEVPRQLTPAVASIEKPSLKLSLSLGTKRKESVDFGSTVSRLGSPKSQKQSRQQTPSDSLNCRSSTPATKVSAAKPKIGKIVALRLGSSSHRAQEILNTPPRPARGSRRAESQTPVHVQASRSITPITSTFASSLVQSPTNSKNFFSAPTVATPSVNLGGFRSYGPTPTPETKSEPMEAVKQESPLFETAPSSLTTNGATMENGNGRTENAISPLAEGMPPPPRPRLTLKLGSRKSSDQGSPE